jgi:hypothetical protein
MQTRFRLGVSGAAIVTAGLVLTCRLPCHAIALDKEGDIKLGVRTYSNVRIGTEDTDSTERFVNIAGPGQPPRFVTGLTNATFPFSAGGHMRQNRYFIEAELDHSLDALLEKGTGPLALMNELPFRVSGFKYHVTFRGELETLYDWGPREYSTAAQYFSLPGNPATGAPVNVAQNRAFLRQNGVWRARLFQAYTEGTVGPLFVRFGRQILSWGETDSFRLLDNINPLDSSFGGFLIDLDERRVPLDMLRAQYFVGNLGPLSEAFVELYGAIDNKVGWDPGTLPGSAWALPNTDTPTQNRVRFFETPARTFTDMRGGGRLVANISDATFSLAHYYTYLDTPALQIVVKPKFPVDVLDPAAASYPGGFSAQVFQSAPLTQITGGSLTFAVPALYTVVRSEAAYFRNEPRFTQQQLDPFIYHFYLPNGQECRPPACKTDTLPTTEGRLTGDSFNYALGFDVNAFIRSLNPDQTFFFSTQLFYKHLFGYAPREPVPGRNVSNGTVLPVESAFVFIPRAGLREFGAVESDFVHEPQDSLLQTLFISTSYMGGKVTPAFTFFYDWGGALFYQPMITLSRDPFRFIVDYSILSAHTLKGGSGVSLLRDRSNIEFRLEYVI